jgi:ketosteroid isomerase-like protein
MSDLNTRAIVDRYGKAMEVNDLEGLAAVLHEDYIEDYPQSGERIHGGANLTAMMANYPGGVPLSARLDTVVGTEDSWVMSASYTPMRIEGTGDQYTAVAHVFYPDGSEWHVIQLIRLKDGKVYRVTSFYAPRFEAPDWRAPFVERVEPT